MKGKIKFIKRSVWLINDVGSAVYGHDTRYTNTYAVLQNGDYVSINENSIRSYYGRQKITDTLIENLSNDLKNVQISYSKREDGNYWLDDDLSALLD